MPSFTLKLVILILPNTAFLPNTFINSFSFLKYTSVPLLIGYKFETITAGYELVKSKPLAFIKV